MSNLRSAQDILAYFNQMHLDEESRDFLNYHFQRYEFLFRRIDHTIEKLRLETREQPLRILDIGPGFQTEILRQTIPNAVVDTLGFLDIRFQAHPQDQHFEFDLNSAQYPERWLKLEPYDLVIMAEVIEHLYTSPAFVLKCVSTWVKPGGYLILQTPNACALHKRLKMLAGKNPFDLIRETSENPGHFREYTRAELATYIKQTGLQWVEYATGNYFYNGSRVHQLYNRISAWLPASLRQGITLITRKL